MDVLPRRVGGHGPQRGTLRAQLPQKRVFTRAGLGQRDVTERRRAGREETRHDDGVRGGRRIGVHGDVAALLCAVSQVEINLKGVFETDFQLRALTI